jgi:hypothetical protein
MVDMRVSTTHQPILREGRIMGGQRILLRLGSDQIRDGRRRDLNCDRGDSRFREARSHVCANSRLGRAQLERATANIVIGDGDSSGRIT